METYPVWIYIDGLEDDGLEKPSQPDMMIPVKMALDFITERTNKAKIGVQSPSIPHDIWDFLSDCTGVGSLCNCEKVLNRARAVKTDWEIGLLRRTAKITENAMLETAYRIVPGMSEKEILSIYRNAAFCKSPGAPAGMLTPPRLPGRSPRSPSGRHGWCPLRCPSSAL